MQIMDQAGKTKMKDDVALRETHGGGAAAAQEESPAPPSRRGARRTPIAMGLAALIVALLAYTTYLAFWPKDQTSRRSGRSGLGGAQPVGVATVTRGDFKVVLRALLGSVTPIANVTVKTQLNGYLTEVAFQEGQLVKKGDFLAQVDPRPYEVLKAQYEGQLLHDQGVLDQARDDLRRYQSLKKLDSIAHQQAENQIWVVKQSEGSVKSDQALVDNQKLNLAYAHIVSPITGRVGLRKVDAGSYVSASDANGIVLVTQLDPISVIFSVPEDYIPEISSAQKKSGALDVVAFDRANVKPLAAGRLQTLDNTIDPTTGMVQARAEFPNKDYELYPNQFVNINLQVDVHKNALLMPKAAIKKGASGFFVYLIKGDNRVVIQNIVPSGGESYDSASDNGAVEVLQGLNEGDRVVVDGSDRLREGAEVRIVANGDGGDAAGPARRDESPAESQPPERRQGDPEKRRERRQKRQTEQQ
jgi:membrane fusion protein, multidrug efflux system